jgi:hypothetical protein
MREWLIHLLGGYSKQDIELVEQYDFAILSNDEVRAYVVGLQMPLSLLQYRTEYIANLALLIKGSGELNG